MKEQIIEEIRSRLPPEIPRLPHIYSAEDVGRNNYRQEVLAILDELSKQ